jgi:Xaa-Pro dipeptidase
VSHLYADFLSVIADEVYRNLSCNDRLFPSTTNVSHTPASGQFSTTALTHDAAAPVSASSSSSTPAPGRGCCGDNPSESFDDLHNGPFLPQVLLIDAGCEFKGGYASDVTRTVPVGNGGKFTDEGKTIYSIVLKMQKVGPLAAFDHSHCNCANR